MTVLLQALMGGRHTDSPTAQGRARRQGVRRGAACSALGDPRIASNITQQRFFNRKARIADGLQALAHVFWQAAPDEALNRRRRCLRYRRPIRLGADHRRYRWRPQAIGFNWRWVVTIATAQAQKPIAAGRRACTMTSLKGTRSGPTGLTAYRLLIVGVVNLLSLRGHTTC